MGHCHLVRESWHLRALLFLIVASCFLITICLSEEHRILGEIFEVEEISEVDSNTVEVLLFGDRRIISKDRLDIFVVQEYFKDLERFKGIQTQTIKKFIERATKDQKFDLAFIAFSGLLLRSRNIGEPSEGDLESFMVEISALDSDRKIFKEALSVTEKRLYPKRVLGALLLYVGLADLKWLRTNATSLIYLEGQAFREAATAEFIEAAKRKDLDQERRIVELLEDLLGKDDKTYNQLKFAVSRIEKVLNVTAEGRIEDLYPLVESSSADPFLGEIIFPILIETFHVQAEKLILDGNPARALIVLSRIGPGRRTPTTHELASRALEKLPPSKDSIIRDWALEVMLRTLAQNDVVIRAKYLSFLESQIRFLLKNRSQGEANFCFSKLISVRPDPDRANDSIRTNMALFYMERGEPALARAKIGEIKTFLSLTNRIKLLMSGYYIEGKLVTALMVIFVLLAFYLLKVRERLTTDSINKEQFTHSRVNITDTQAEGDPVVGGFNVLQNRGMFSPRFEEYKRCLKVLGLVPEASLKDIKWAYRNGVKELHPDSAEVSGDQNDSEGFIQLSATYERILELRKELGMGDE